MLTRNRNIPLYLCPTLQPPHPTSPPSTSSPLNPRFIHPPVQNRLICRLQPLVEAKGPWTLISCLSLSLPLTEWHANKPGQTEGIYWLLKKLHGQGWFCDLALLLISEFRGLTAGDRQEFETSNSVWSLSYSGPVTDFRGCSLQILELPLALCEGHDGKATYGKTMAYDRITVYLKKEICIYVYICSRGLSLEDNFENIFGCKFAYTQHKFVHYVHESPLPNKVTWEHLLYSTIIYIFP